MTTTVLVLATVWAMGAIGFFAALGLAAKRTMPVPETDHFESGGMAFTDAELVRPVRRDLAGNVGPLLGHRGTMLAVKGTRA